nr:hypothetical protein [Tanacetum cinerariifolium]
MLASGTYSVEAVRALDTHRTPIQKQPEALLCLVGISRRYYLGDDVYPTFHYDDDRGGLICAPNPTKVKTRSRPRAPHELPLLTLTALRIIEMDEPAAATDSSGVPSAIERSPLDFAYEVEASGRETAAPEMPPSEEVPITTAPGADRAAKIVAVEPPAVRESRKRGHEGIDANAPPKSLRRDHADLRPIRAPNPTKVKTGSRPRAPHELPLLTLTAPRVIEMDEPAVVTDSFGVLSVIERSPLDFADEAEASGRETAAPEMPPPEESLRKDHADLRPSGSSRGGKSLAAMQLYLASNIFMSEGVPADVSDPNPLAFADAPSPHPADVAQGVTGRDPILELSIWVKS